MNVKIIVTSVPHTMKVSRQKSFVVFALYRMSAKLFCMKVQDGGCSSMDLRESMRDSAKVFT